MFKHDLLKRYLPQFGAMMGTRSRDKRVVYLDERGPERAAGDRRPLSAVLLRRLESYMLHLMLLCSFGSG
ncbi:hypothetical protein [Streptomyces sp. NRRL S-118]|uniref:hypothetical protein n=1 Tax=Streptomyces sp. NRRL S-118 TaxID=1463881 RepID=UPI00069380E6|nr:hypothetical protein [Streptomyces sp. NRRL S-118]